MPQVRPAPAYPIYPGAAAGRRLRSVAQPYQPSLVRRPGRPAHVLFEVCSAFTHVAACTLALPPVRDTLSEGLSHFVTLYGAFFVKGSNLAPMFFCSTGSGHLAGRRRSGLRDNQRGNPPSCAAHGRDTTLYSVAPYEAHHDAVIRILGEVPRRRPHSPCRRLKPW